MFTQITSKGPGDQEAFQIPASKTVFTLHARPIIIAAYVYELSSRGQRHVRFLLYERGGKRDSLIVPPFLYKMDLPLAWIGGHEDYGDYNQLIRGLEAQFEHPILPDYLSMAVVSAKNCEDANDVNRQLCSELARRDIELPADYEAAEALVMDQWDIAIQKTTTDVIDVEQAVGLVNEIGTAWWDDSRFALFYLPRLIVCLPGDRPLCGTYITYEMAIDTFGLLPR